MHAARDYKVLNNWRRDGDMSDTEEGHSSGDSHPSVPSALAHAAPLPPHSRTMGSLHKFQPDSENFSTYMERVEIDFGVNNIPEETGAPVFCNAVGGRCTGYCTAYWPQTTPCPRAWRR